MRHVMSGATVSSSVLVWMLRHSTTAWTPLSSLVSVKRISCLIRKTDRFTSSITGSRTKWNPFHQRCCTSFVQSTRKMSSYSTETSTTQKTNEYSNCDPTEKERQMHKDARVILAAGIQAVDPRIAIQSCIQIHPQTNSFEVGQNRRLYSAENYDHVTVISFGKASVPMALTTCELVQKAFGTKCSSMNGIVVAKDDHFTQEEANLLLNTYNVHVQSASHPVPDERGVQAATNVMQLISNTSKQQRTLILCCISGGGSALLTLPIGNITLKDIQITSELLLQSGMPIHKMNVIRKRLDAVKGGRLAAAAYPSTMCTLVLSDVIGDPLSSIASGPTVPDEDDNTLETARRILMEYDLLPKLPQRVLELFERATNYNNVSSNNSRNTNNCATDSMWMMETPKSNHPMFTSKKGETILVGNNKAAVLASAKEAEKLGYTPVVLGTCIEGEAKEVAQVYTAMAMYLLQQQQQPTDSKQSFSVAQLPVALIAGGETTVTFHNEGDNYPKMGKGGRNQELCLAAALLLQEKKVRDIVIASVGTDGGDGPTDAAGAIVDGGTIERIEQLQQQSLLLFTGSQALRCHDSYTFFGLEDGRSDNYDCPSLIKTGPTGTNVADVAVILIR